MDFPLGYIIALRPQLIAPKWPNMQLGINSEIKSLKRKNENCLAFVLGESIEVDMVVFSKHLHLDLCELNKEKLDHSINAYSKLLSYFYKFEECESSELEQGYKKIALYENIDEEGDIGFSHVALLLENGKWKSKLGWLEDIEHETLQVLSGDFYGNPVLYMKRPDDIHITYMP